MQTQSHHRHPPLAEPVVVLAGGLGTRLQAAVPDLPKVMAPVAGQPFLFWLLRALERQGARRIVLSLGWRAEAVTGWLAEAELPGGLVVESVVEAEPLGTGGALRHSLAEAGIAGRFYLLNGDTYIVGGLADLADAPADWPEVMGLVEVPDTARYGRVELAREGRIAGFREKGESGPGFINAGLLRLSAAALPWPAERRFSLEQALLPALAAGGRLRGWGLAGRFVDIGLPDDYKAFGHWAAGALAD